MNIALPPSLETFVEDQISKGCFEDASDYFRDLLRREQKRIAKEEFQSLLIDDLDPGAE